MLRELQRVQRRGIGQQIWVLCGRQQLLFRHVSELQCPELGSRNYAGASAESGMPRQTPLHERAWAFVAFACDQHVRLRVEVVSKPSPIDVKFRGWEGGVLDILSMGVAVKEGTIIRSTG